MSEWSGRVGAAFTCVNPKSRWQAWLQPRSVESLVLTDAWGTSILLIVVSVIVLFFVFGFWWPYWRTADMDLGWTYEAFLYNDGQPQEIFDHPGYLMFLLLGLWLHFLHWIGLVSVDALSQLPPPAEAAAAWTEAIRAGRVMSMVFTVALITAFAFLLRTFIENWRIAVLGALAFAFSGGVEMHARIIRSELLSGGLVTIALLILLICAKRPSIAWRPVLIGISASCCVLALINKVQVIDLICALPVIALLFGIASAENDGFWRRSRYAPAVTAAIVACAILFSIPAEPLVSFGLSQFDTFLLPWQPLLAGWHGIYQTIMVGWIFAMMICFAVVWQAPILETIAAMAAVVAGTALALTSLYAWYNPQNVLAVMNPLELLHYWAVTSNAELGGDQTILSWNFIGTLLRGVGRMLATKTFVLDSSARPTIFLEWFVIAGTIFAWRAGERKLAAQTAILMCTVWVVDTVSTLRGLQIAYFIYTDPLVIIATCLLLANLTALRNHRWAYQLGGVLIATHIVLGLSEPIKHTFQRSIPVIFCPEHLDHTLQVQTFSFCLDQPNTI